MMFTHDELRQMLYCCAEELRARAQGKLPGPQPWLRNLVRRLEIEVALSPSRHSAEGDGSDSDHDESIIGTHAAAEILGWTTKQVQRRAADLDGRKVSGKLVFSERAVREYAEGLTDDRATA